MEAITTDTALDRGRAAFERMAWATASDELAAAYVVKHLHAHATDAAGPRTKTAA